ncbi:MAG: potassium channel family protein [Planctomycetota bacterium]|jgi:voltage-gated potassium channel
MNEKNTCTILKNHLIICGAGSTAEHIIEELDNYKTIADENGNRLGTGIVARDYLIIDSDEKRCTQLKKRYPSMNYMIGDATEDETLERSNIHQAYGIFAVLPNDKDNLFITFTAKQKKHNIRIVSRTIDIYNTGQKLRKAGADAVVSPNFIGGLRMVSEISRPHVTEFLDEMLRNKASDLQIKELNISRESSFISKNLKELNLTNNYRIIIVAIQKTDGSFMYNPDPATQIMADDKLVAFGKGNDIYKLEKII